MELCRRMMHYLIDNYGTDPAVTNLVNNAELWFCPMSNPDGIDQRDALQRPRRRPEPRLPRPGAPIRSTPPTGREIEVQHLMNFEYPHNFILGANYHGGALVMNLPWDYTTDRCRPTTALLWQLGNGYSVLNPPM